MKFTFKTTTGTGRFKSFHKYNTSIKYKKIEVGYIDGDNFNIRFQVVKKDIMEDGNPNCSWKWITLKHKPTSLDDAKTYCNDNIERIFSSFDIYIKEN